MLWKDFWAVKRGSQPEEWVLSSEKEWWAWVLTLAISLAYLRGTHHPAPMTSMPLKAPPPAAPVSLTILFLLIICVDPLPSHPTAYYCSLISEYTSLTPARGMVSNSPEPNSISLLIHL